jgi:hypothetical protein
MKMLKMVRVILTTVLLVMLMGAAQPVYALTNSQPAIQPQWASVVQLRSEDKEDNSNDMVTAFCNGTLLSASWLITAAHCTRGPFVSGTGKFQVEVGSYIIKPNKEGKLVRIGYMPHTVEQKIGKIFLLPSQEVGVEDDIALIQFSEPVKLPEDFKFPTLLSEIEMRQVLANLNSQMIMAVTLNPIEEISTDTKRMGSPLDFNFSWRGVIESKSGARVQPGDSGAPLFVNINGNWKVLGVVKGQAKNFFSNWDVYPIADKRLCQMMMSRLPASEQSFFCP